MTANHHALHARPSRPRGRSQFAERFRRVSRQLRRPRSLLVLLIVVGVAGVTAVLTVHHGPATDSGAVRHPVAVHPSVQRKDFNFARASAAVPLRQLVGKAVPLRTSAQNLSATLDEGVGVVFNRSAGAAKPVVSLDLVPTGSKVAVTVLDSHPTIPTVDGGTVTYAQIIDGVTLRYVAHPSSVNETITLAKAVSDLGFGLSTAPGTRLTADAQGGLVAQAAGGRDIFYLQPMTATDADGHPVAYRYGVTKTVSGFSVSVMPSDPAQAAGAHYPVTIDPTISWNFTPATSYTLSNAAEIQIVGGVVSLKDNAGTYATDNPYVTNTTGVPFTTLSGFAQTLDATNQGTVQYQLSTNGTAWYWWSGTAWVTATGYAQSDSAATVNTNAGTFGAQVGTGSLYFRAFLHAATATTPVALDNVTFTYTGPPPTLTAVAPASGPTAGGAAVTLSGTGFYSNPAPAAFTYTGANQTWTVPAGVTSVTVKEWGGGGSGGGGGYSYPSPGGGAGYTTGVLAVTPGEVLTVMVGAGGAASGPTVAADYGGGGPSKGDYTGQGGGRSAVRVGGIDLLTAGGGGGGGAMVVAGNDATGGAGGGSAGVAGSDTAAAASGGGGGTQSAGGAGGTGTVYVGSAGVQYLGGSQVSYGYGGSGGGGWYGGGGGTASTSNTKDLGGGGGGSGYVAGAGVSAATTTAGAGAVQANASDPVDGGAGAGGAAQAAGAAGTVSITLGGSTVYSGPPVTFGGVAATNVTVVNSTTITATTPADLAGGAVAVIETNPDGQSATLSSGYTYMAPPSVTSVTPNSALNTGGSSVVITGTAFQATPTVSFGAVAATSVTWVSATSLSVVVPAHTVGPVGVTVTNPDTQTFTLANGFTYVYPAPTITGVSPTSGPTAGGTAVTVSGTGFYTGVVPVTFAYTGADQTYTVPSGVTSVTVKEWGGGGSGGGGCCSWPYPSPGGGGGYSTATLAVTPGQVLTVMVGAGGAASGPTVPADYGGGGPNLSGYTGQGGGRSAIRVSGVDVLTAGGGGGGGAMYAAPGNAAGGAGGGSSGVAGSNSLAPVSVGGGGTQGAGGAGGTGSFTGSAGTQYLGGTQAIYGYGGSGGGGWYGGGGGAYGNGTNDMGGGGGGSGYVGGTGVSAASTTAGAGTVQANSTDPADGGAGAGGGVLAAGVPGTVIVTSSVAPTLTFGGVAVTNMTIVNSTTITATVPAHAAGGAVAVTETNPDTQSATLANGYTYVAPPSVTSVTPNTAVITGGSSVVITGTGFQATPTVSIGGVAATSVTWVNATTLDVVVPAHSVGPVGVTVTNPDTQTFSLAGAFTYTGPPPTLTAVAPASGPTAGGAAVTLSGTGFYSNPAPAAFTYTGANQTWTVPAGVTSVTVKEWGGGGSGGGGGYSYPSPGGGAGYTTGVLAVTPGEVLTVMVGAGGAASGPTVAADYGGGGPSKGDYTGQGGGRSAVRVGGIDLLTAGGGGGGGAMVVAGNDATGGAGGGSAGVAGSDTAAAASGGGGGTQSAGGAGGTGTVYVGSAGVQYLGGSQVSYGYGGSGGGGWYGGGGGTASTSNTKDLGGGGGGSGYVAGAGVSAATTTAGAGAVQANASDPVDGGAGAGGAAQAAGAAGTVSITLGGSTVYSGPPVTFGGVAATNVTVVNSTTITATTPADLAGGAVAVIETNPDGQSATLSSGYTYMAPPSVTSVTPNSALNTGGSSVVITGTAFQATPTVSFGAVAATSVTWVSATSLSVVVPAHTVGPVGVTVTNPDTQTFTLANGFTYVYPAPTITGVSPTSGPTAGGTAVTVSGTGFYTGVVPVTFAYTGADQTYTVPSGVTSVTVKEWGGGGSGGGPGYLYPSSGGGGGYSTATLAVTPGQVLTVMVGAGGAASGPTVPADYGGGGPNLSGYTGQGGGRSAIRVSGVDVLTAGGGGGGGTMYHTGNNAAGGAGGGAGGVAGTDSLAAAAGGGGGTQGAGGAGGTGAYVGSAGTQYLGGTQASGWGGSGGGGWYGGGGGGDSTSQTYDFGGGGGGSGYVGGAGVSAATTTAGTGAVQANAADPADGGAGAGGAVLAAGAPGTVIVTSSVAPTLTFGGVAVTNMTIVNSSTITAKAPADPAGGAVAVTETNPDGQSATLANGYAYVPSKYVITTPSLNQRETQPGAMTVVAESNSGTPVALPTDTVLSLSSTSTYGFFAEACSRAR